MQPNTPKLAPKQVPKTKDELKQEPTITPDQVIRSMLKKGNKEVKRKPFPKLQRFSENDPLIETLNSKGPLYLARFVETKFLWSVLTDGKNGAKEIWDGETARRIKAIIKLIGKKAYKKAKDFFDKHGKPKIRKLKMLILKKILTPEEVKTVKRYEALKLKEEQMEKDYANEKSTMRKIKLYAQLKVLKLRIKKEQIKILLIFKRIFSDKKKEV